MCGIIGFLGGDFTNDQLSNAILEEMSGQLVKRGPDSAGIWLDSSSKIALGHRRLAVVDLSPAGYQPMTSGSNRYVMTYNGEIYNSNEIRNELIKSQVTLNWQGHSDTETLLAGFDGRCGLSCRAVASRTVRGQRSPASASAPRGCSTPLSLFCAEFGQER